MDKNVDVFTTSDVFGYSVTLSQSTWNNHIISGHPEMIGNETATQRTIENPQYVYQSIRNADSKVFFAKTAESSYPQIYTSVVVDYDGNTNGEVKTAYVTRKITNSIKQGGLLYENSQP